MADARLAGRAGVGSSSPSSSADPDRELVPDRDASELESPPRAGGSRRTHLAGERTQLAWWRTGLAALAVGIGIGRVIPELAPELTRWPYVALGTAFAVYGVVLIWHGSVRRRRVDDALDRGGYATQRTGVETALALAGASLGVATGILILAG